VHDTELIEQIKAGNQSAYSRLMDRYMPLIYSLNLRMLRNSQDAEDATQDVFIQAFRQIDQFRGQSRFSTWLYRIAVNMNLRKLKKLRRINQEIDVTALIDLPDPNGNPLTHALAHDERETLDRLITKLPPKQKLVLMLRAIRQMPFSEIAAITKRSLGSVKANYFLAVQNLTLSLRKEGGKS